jgi:hypothetical protein
VDGRLKGAGTRSRPPQAGDSGSIPALLHEKEASVIRSRLALKAAILLGLLVAASLAGHWLEDRLAARLTTSIDPAAPHAVVGAVALYVVLLALPFVPGVEIGLILLAMFGASIAPVVYGATVLALFCSFLIGRLLPEASAAPLFDRLRLHRVVDGVRRMQSLPLEKRLELLVRNAPSRIVPFLLRHRYIALMMALNLPGNTLIGGGGGIGLAAGYSRLFGTGGYLAAVALGVAPVPLAVIVMGS